MSASPNLPKVGSTQVLLRLRAAQRTEKIPVVVLTVSNGDISECRRLGAETYVVKPVGRQNFIEVASRLSLAWVLVKPNGTLSAQPNESILNQR